MTTSERMIMRTDAFLNCIPLVNTVNNAAQALYKLAHRVDVLNPVAPGLKTSIQIHILSKENFELFFTAIPICGNVFALIKLALSFCVDSSSDPLMTAVLGNNRELARLCAENHGLDNPRRARHIFQRSSYNSNNETFREILYGRPDWDNSTLLEGLDSPLTPQNAHDILDFWIAQEKILTLNNLYPIIHAIKVFLVEGNTELANRIIDILPEKIPFCHLYDFHSIIPNNSLLVNYLCPQHYQGELEKTPLTKEQRLKLIAKSEKPSLEELSHYCDTVSPRIKDQNISQEDRLVYLRTLNELLDLAELSSIDVSQLILHALTTGDIPFARDFIERYKDQIDSYLKIEILKYLLRRNSNQYDQRIQLFDSCISKWKDDVNHRAHQLYVELCNVTKKNQEVVLKTPALVTKYDYPSVDSYQAMHDGFKEILLKAFPGCDREAEVA